jgi:aerotolerance regulator-like protein
MDLPFLHIGTFLLGLGLVALPIIIHLLNRRRFRVMPWAAMQFLADSIRRSRTKLRLEELLLLALRCLILLLIAAGIARFTGCSGAAISGLVKARSSVFVLDDSFSMGQRVGAGTVFRLAAQDLVNQIRSLPKADRLAVILASQAPTDPPLLKLTARDHVDMDSLRRKLEALRPSDHRANLEGMLSTGGDALEPGASGRVVLLGDFRSADLEDLAASRAAREQFDRLRKRGVDLVAIDYAHPPRDNLTVESVVLLDKLAVANVDARVAVTVRNHSPKPANDVQVDVSARFAPRDGQADPIHLSLPARMIDSIEPGQTSRVEFPLTPPWPGSAAIDVKLSPDELPNDSRGYLALDVRKEVRVLIVEGANGSAPGATSSSDFLATAIDPNRDGNYGVSAEVVGVESLAGQALDGYDVVTLLDVPELPGRINADGTITHPQLEALEQWVASGGGLAIFTGDSTDLTFANGALHREGQGLSPFPIGPRAGDPVRRETFFRLDPAGVAPDSVMRQFYGEAAVCTQLVRFHAFTPAREIAASSGAQAGPPRVLARFDDPDSSPAVVARPFGKGTVLIYYTTAGTEWNDWGVDEPPGVYVGAMLDMVHYLARAQAERGGQLVGEPLVLDLAPAMREARATLRTPNYPRTDLVSLVARRRYESLGEDLPAGETQDLTDMLGSEIRYERAGEAGVYSLTLDLPTAERRSVFFARNCDPREGDLTPGGQSLLESTFQGEDFTYVSRSDSPETVSLGRSTRGSYWLIALASALVLMVAETLLARRFGHHPAEGRRAS